MTGPDPRRDPPQRVRVTAPTTTRQTHRYRRSAAGEIDAQTEVGAIFLHSLLRAQLRLAAGVLLALVVSVGGLPLLFLLAPGVASREVLGMPLSWCILAFAVYPVLLGLGWVFVRRSERNERAFTDVVEGS